MTSKPTLKERIAKQLRDIFQVPTDMWTPLVEWELLTDKTKEIWLNRADKVLVNPEIKEALELLELKRQGKLVKLAHNVTNVKSRSWQMVEPL